MTGLDLYERIADLCKAKGVSVSRMCLDVGMSKSTLSGIKCGKKNGLSTANAAKIAGYLSVSMEYLLGIDEAHAQDNFMFYDKFQALCKRKGVSCNRAALEIGLSSATPTKWKRTEAVPSGDTLERIARYFNVSIEELLGVDRIPNDSSPDLPRPVTDTDLMYALFGHEVPDSLLEEVKHYACFVKERFCK